MEKEKFKLEDGKDEEKYLLIFGPEYDKASEKEKTKMIIDHFRKLADVLVKEDYHVSFTITRNRKL